MSRLTSPSSSALSLQGMRTCALAVETPCIVPTRIAHPPYGRTVPAFPLLECLFALQLGR